MLRDNVSFLVITQNQILAFRLKNQEAFLSLHFEPQIFTTCFMDQKSSTITFLLDQKRI